MAKLGERICAGIGMDLRLWRMVLAAVLAAMVLTGVGIFFNSDHAITRLLAAEHSGSGFTYIEIKRNGGEICITGVTDPSAELVIPSELHGLPVTVIGESAFENCTSLKSITIPDTVTEIGERAFALCHNLEHINLPPGITEISTGLFFVCNSLEHVELPDSIKKIRAYAFYRCTSLKSMEIPDGVTKIRNYAFYSCTCLKSIKIPDSVTRIGEMAFDECMALDSVTISPKTDYAGDAFPEWTRIRKRKYMG